MIRRCYNHSYHRPDNGAGSDTDALQTDVMRFMSIIGLCLMAVFALVQSLPKQENHPQPIIPEPNQSNDEVSQQQEHIAALRLEQQQLNESIAQDRKKKKVAQQELTTIQQNLTQALTTAKQTQSEVKQLQQHLQFEQNRLHQIRKKISQNQQTLKKQNQPHPISKTNPKPERQAPIVTKVVRQEYKYATPQPVEKNSKAAQAPTQDKSPKQKQAPPPKSAAFQSPRIGFTLSFSSDNALAQLVAKGGVSLYAMINQQAWKLSLSNSRPVFSTVEFPTWFHEMASATVPSLYTRQFRIVMAPSAKDSVVWGVQLPPHTKNAIKSLTQNHQGGDIIISANGRVVLEE